MKYNVKYYAKDPYIYQCYSECIIASSDEECYKKVENRMNNMGVFNAQIYKDSHFTKSIYA